MPKKLVQASLWWSRIYRLIPEPSPVEYDSIKFCREKYSISSGVWSTMDKPSSATSRMRWNSQSETNVDCWSWDLFSEICCTDERLRFKIVGSSFSGIQSLILTTFTFPSLTIVTRRPLLGPPATWLGWWSLISSISYFCDVLGSSPSINSSTYLSLPRSSHEKEVAAPGSRDLQDSLEPLACWNCIGRKNERFSILLIALH